MLVNQACVNQVIFPVTPVAFQVRFLCFAGGVAAIGDACFSVIGDANTLMTNVMNNNAARVGSLWKLAIILFIHYHFSIWEVENHFECVEADKYAGPRHFPELVYRTLGLQSLDLIDWQQCAASV